MVKTDEVIQSSGCVSHAALAAFVSCPTKLDLLARHKKPSDPEFLEGILLADSVLRPRQLACLAKRWSVSKFRSKLHTKCWIDSATDSQVVLDWLIKTDAYMSRIDAVKLVVAPTFKHVVPIRYFGVSKITEAVRVLLCFDGMVLESGLGYRPSEGIAILGWETQAAKVKFTDALWHKTHQLISDVIQLRRGDRERTNRSTVRLNSHCSICQYQHLCLEEAKAADDLSLLSAMSKKDKDRMRKRGIFTTNQYSYTFQLRRDRKALRGQRERRQHALTALAMRDQKTYVLGEPEFVLSDGDAFVDVEGDLTRGACYLIGVLHDHDGSLLYKSFWADDPDQEGEAFRSFVKYLLRIRCERIVHYGAYEADWLKRMLAKHELSLEASNGLQVIVRHNLLQTIYDHIYFPCRSNALKEVGAVLGATWRYPKASGARANFWRLEWEVSREEKLKSRLVQYNEDDCRGLAIVSTAISTIVSARKQHAVAISNTPLLGINRRTFANDDLKEIARAAYWDRQRDLIYLGAKRKKPRPKKLSSRKPAWPLKCLTTEVYNFCPKCASRQYKAYQYCKTIWDIRFKRNGMVGVRVKHVGWRVTCPTCKTSVTCRQEPWPTSRFGSGLVAFFVYQLIEHVGVVRSVGRMIDTLFGLTVVARNLRVESARRYFPTYEQILADLKASHVIYADETRIRLRCGEAYVWVLSNFQSVYFFYTPSREAGEVKRLLTDYSGVVVSDFYAGYDALPCRQQKCLIHLMRDLNDDILKNPFDPSLREFADEFADTMRTIIGVIDKHGHSKSALEECLPSAEKLINHVCEIKVHDSTAPMARYKDRFARYGSNLFEFMNHDGVSWNNNSAEHAIKEFARVRNQVDGLLTPASLNDYLVLMSVCVTCKYRDISVLNYLASGATLLPSKQ